MRLRPPSKFFASAAIALLLLVAANAPLPCCGADSASARTLFKNPPRAYSTGPLWVWNDMLTEDQIRGTLRDLAAQQVKQAFVHPRPGLMTPYLSADWFRLWKVALAEAKRLDMNLWIYDENSYPSGFAGGMVPEAMPESRGRGLNFQETKTPPAWSEAVIGVYSVTENGGNNVTAKVRSGETLAAGRFVTATEVRAGNSPWHGGRCYVNLLSPGVTEKFLELTLEPYRRELGAEFGRRLPGVFTDEPNIRPAGQFAWSEILRSEFQKRWGYDLLEQLPALAQPVGDWQKVRHNYYQVLNEQFIEHWSKPYHDYCASNHLEWTGHYWDHEWPNCGAVPDNMAMYAWHQRPAIDCLMNQYAEHTHAQFGNVRMVRELSSVANQLGIKRTLCEAYGAGGWDLRFEDMKRIGDWLEVLGVNTIDQHLSYVTLRGARKRDHPQSFSYQEPWWSAYHVSASYLARISAALSQGEQIHRVLVLEPTTTAWMHQGEGAKLDQLGNGFCNLLMSLEAAQIEYDIGDEDIMARHGKVSPSTDGGSGPARSLDIGQRSYRTVVLPQQVENLNEPTARLLEAFLQGGKGRVLALGEPPARVDGSISEHGRLLANQPGWKRVSLEGMVGSLADSARENGFTIQRRAGDRGVLFHHRRRFQDGQLVFLVNTSITEDSAGSILSDLNGVEVWDLYSGKITAYPSQKSATGITTTFSLPPSGSLLLFLTAKARPAPPVSVASVAKVRDLPLLGQPDVRRLGPNVLTLDYVDVAAGGTVRTNIYTYQANQFVWKQNGLERDPWDSAVQYKNELIAKRFLPQSGFAATYKFNIEGAVPTHLAIVIERPDLYSISCNGKPVTQPCGITKAPAGSVTPATGSSTSAPGEFADWWLDKSFARIPISALARTGENTITLNATPFTMFHELEPAYVLGNFSLKAVAAGFVIAPDEGLQLSDTGWNQQGHPFYSQGVAYRERFLITDPKLRHILRVPSWYGSVAQVTVNGKLAGFVDAPPWECDVSSHLKRGTNEVQLAVIGTLKNTLGPHHGKPPLGAAWPASFHQAPASGPPPGAQYSTVSYGLFAPFRLQEVGIR